ncbi:MAG: NADH-quinone oxidoreductase subunit J [Opitutae bacterium]|nr:NADH-quinone oxidoreductase subunit J [Opitutae bacterium]
MELLEAIVDGMNYWIFIILMMIGLYAMITKNNLVKKLIGMSIFQTAILLFYISLGVKEGATIPILPHYYAHTSQEEQGNLVGSSDQAHAGKEASSATEGGKEKPSVAHAGSPKIDPNRFTNPLPHVLMLTAIVVGVSTLGVALSITQKLYTEFGTIEENEILDQLKSGDD